VTDFEEGARRALEWLGRSEDAAELAQIVGEMPKIWRPPSSLRLDGPRSPGIRPRRKLRLKQRLGQLRCHRCRRRRPSTSTNSEGDVVREKVLAKREKLLAMAGLSEAH
jgi:hypothetical protein